MMAAEVSSEDTGSVSTGTGVAGSGGPQTAHFPYYSKSTKVRVGDLGQQGAEQVVRQNSNTSPDSLPESIVYPRGEMSATGSGVGHSLILGTSSGTVGGACCSPTSDDPGSRMSPTSSCPDGSNIFPPLPPPPPPPPVCGMLSTVDESDMQDGPEYEEEEVVFPLSAPPTNQWYHGKLDRTIAEERLRQAKTPGSYLIRESDRRPGSFVLSFLSMTSVVNHFRVTEVAWVDLEREMEDSSLANNAV
ncbi:hypothetical protein NHX12_028248 [Muraenolepis orangiensis]|uniref:SH2 domain-containing protein n=1 Tax=Muraenolepis orangiensis TaxID=630683 RepID=A0A9Q0EBT9_9TELE|nr:hypothetical protein NHX12_028248 [Muraenolepis orangiensis]